MRGLQEARSWAQKTYDRHAFAFLASHVDGSDGALHLRFQLHPPTASFALNEGGRVAEWITAWTSAHMPIGCEVLWEERRWRGLGRQRVPSSLDVHSASALAALAGRSADWSLLTSRLTGLREMLVENAEGARGIDGAEVLARAMQSCARDLRVAADPDFARAIAVTRWFLDHPDSGLYMRQLPIAGVDSKWVERHRRLIAALLGGAREVLHRPGGTDFGVASLPRPRDVVFADPLLRPMGIRHAMLDTGELGKLWESSGDVDSRPRVLLVLENKQTLFALPDLDGVVAVHGGGYAIDHVESLNWAVDIPLLYWGDLDADGLTILHRLRHHHRDVRSLMMDAGTLGRYRDLSVPDPQTWSVPPSLLTAEERVAWEAVHEDGGVRLEQERIEWSWALEQLMTAIAQLRW
ncbi:DUF3322 domain-containing protein [Actinomyces culturomici]|uniref:DUF3322 domain-containing protein n=1 Tax=Actinomyces culturomici TaxID=1926276 RepID=UPI000E205A84|nr:DUF3322 domain-containing protein [Actinomyces culturomici]